MKKKMKKIKKRIIFGLLFMSLLFNSSVSVYADPETERVYLTEIRHQLDALQPLLQAAEIAQNKTARVRLHYTAYRDRQGKIHTGLREQLADIKIQLDQALDHASPEPAPLPPIKDDVVASHHGGRVW